MPRIPLLLVVALGVTTMLGCREPLDFDRSFMADPDRGERLYKANCANSCHPDNAFNQKSVKSYEELAYTVRDYYEQVMGDSTDYTQQDIFDIARYLNEKHYKFKTNMTFGPEPPGGRRAGPRGPAFLLGAGPPSPDLPTSCHASSRRTLRPTERQE